MIRSVTSSVPAVALVAVLAISGGRAGAQPQSFAKDVAAPPEDVLAGIVRLPRAAELWTASAVARVPLTARPDPRGGWSLGAVVPLDAPGELALLLTGPRVGGLDVAAAGPALAGARVRLDELAAAGRAARWSGAFDAAGREALRFDLEAPRAGALGILARAPAGERPDGVELWVRGAGPVRARARLSTLETVAGRPIGVLAQALDENGAPVERIDAARLDLLCGSRRLGLEMRDDGAHLDGAAGDGTFGALLPDGGAGWVGEVQARVRLSGRGADGLWFVRTVDLAFPVLEPAALLSGRVATRVLDDERLAIDLGAAVLGGPRRLHVSAEVWGADAAGEVVPVAWLSRMMESPEAAAGEADLVLTLDVRWMNRAGVTELVELRELRVQDPATEVPLDRLAVLPLPAGPLPAAAGAAPGPVTEDMLAGRPPGTSAPLGDGFEGAGAASAARALMLVHGYCSSGTPWPVGQFSEPKRVFLDPDQNRSHDAFALLIRAAGADLGSFGVVAHSQGGPAALHLYTYYRSGLDRATGARRIQSVGSPYQGTPLASLGFFLCGVNSDMTPAGSANWLAGIPSWARAEVSYWTTSNSGPACQGLTDFFLTNPEDGVVEQFRGQLPGASSMGHTLGWCHTSGMSNPPQTSDAARNAAMDAAAAR